MSLDIKQSTAGLLSEMFWTLNYLMDYDEPSVEAVLTQISNLVQRACQELDYEGDRLQESPVNRPIIRIIGNLLTLPLDNTD